MMQEVLFYMNHPQVPVAILLVMVGSYGFSIEAVEALFPTKKPTP